MKLLLIQSNNEFKSYLSTMLQTLGISVRLFDEEGFYSGKHCDYAIIDKNFSGDDVLVNSDFCFINMDNTYNGNMQINSNIITYGLGLKNTITVSSIDEENTGFVYCIQRYLSTTSNYTIAPQEIPINAYFSCDSELYAFLVGITIALIEKKEHKEIIEVLTNNVNIYN